MWIMNLGHIPSLHEKDTSITLVSRASAKEIEAVKECRGTIRNRRRPIGANPGPPFATRDSEPDSRQPMTYDL